MFNLLLRINRYGRYALSKNQVVASNWFGGFLAAGVVLGLAGWLCDIAPVWMLGIWCGLMLAPVSMSMQLGNASQRRRLCMAAAILGAVGLGSIPLIFVNDLAGQISVGLFVLGWALFPLLVNLFG
jgi:hypothetical protein